jgi:hypothetical protein
MRYLSVLTNLVLIIAFFSLGSSLQAQSEGETPELVVLPEADTGLNADMTRAAKLYTNLMWAVYCRTGEYNLAKSKTLYDALIDDLESDGKSATLAKNKFLSPQDLSLIYTERASLRFPKLQDINGAEEDAETAIELDPENVAATWVLAQTVTNRFYRMERNRNDKKSR